MTTLQRLLGTLGELLARGSLPSDDERSQLVTLILEALDQERWKDVHNALEAALTVLGDDAAQVAHRDVSEAVRQLYRDLVFAGVVALPQEMAGTIFVGKLENRITQVRDLSDQAFEQLCARLLMAEGFRVELLRNNVEADVIARAPRSPDRWAFEFKSSDDADVVRNSIYRLHAAKTVLNASNGVLVVNTRAVSNDLRTLAQRLEVLVWDARVIAELWIRHETMLLPYVEGGLAKLGEFRLVELHVENFRGFEQLAMRFDERENVIVGVNGAGKTTILDAINILLSWIPASIAEAHFRGHGLKASDVRYGRSESRVSLSAIFEGQPIDWSVSRSGDGSNVELNRLTEITSRVKESLGRNPQRNLPLLMHYPAAREIRRDGNAAKQPRLPGRYDLYDRALNGRLSASHFVLWFKEREDIENEQLARGGRYRDSQLESLRTILHTLVPRIENPRIERPANTLVFEKGESRLNFEQLSSGERAVVAIATDLTWRLTLANPTRTSSLDGHGIVLVDEFDLHLHPSWQRTALPKLREAFPNLQFIVTTHSPQVLSSVRSGSLRVLEEDRSNKAAPPSTFGRDSNSILRDVMHVSRYPEDTQQQLSAIASAIDHEHFSEASTLLEKLAATVGDEDTEVVRMRALISLLRSED